MSGEVDFDEEGNIIENPSGMVDEDPNGNLDHPDPEDPLDDEDELEGGPEDSGPQTFPESEDDDERKAIRERRREERKNRKIAQREREESLRRELAARDAQLSELRTRLDSIDRRNTGSELAQVQNAKKEAAGAYNYFKDQIRIASEANNGAAVADATEKMIQTRDRFNHLDQIEKAITQRQAAPQPLDPRLVNHAQEWMKKNSWYDPQGRDTDSDIVMRLDSRLSAEGWDPTTQEYWKELSSRVEKYLPHRANRGKMGNTKPRSVVTGSGRDAAGSESGAKGTYRLSADRVQAMKDAGIWDDPKARADMIKRYRDQDKKQSNQG